MENTAIIIAKLRMLATAQVTDEAWLSAASEVVGFALKQITVERWMEEFDLSQRGKVEKIIIDEKEGFQWNRPDDGTPLFMIADVPEHIILSRYLLFSNLIDALKKDNQASFMKAGLLGWDACKIYLNGQEMSFVMSADAILNTVECAVKDKAGKWILSEDKSSIETQKLSGIVRIVMQQERQSFF